MNIRIDENYSIKSDLRNVMLIENKVSQEGKNKGEKYEYVLGYYGNVGMALKAYLKFATNLSEATTVKELLADIENIEKRIYKTIEKELRRRNNE